MPYPVKSIVNAILNKARSEGVNISHLKLQKLLYYACGYYIAAYDEPLIDHTFEAWDYGPVVPKLYHEFKIYGGRPITGMATTLDWDTGKNVPVAIPTDPKVQKVIDFVWNAYGKRTGTQLSTMTHAPNTPWDQVRKEFPGIKDADITHAKLKEHFSKYVNKQKAA